MTHDEQIMVARAVLAGARFWQDDESRMWRAYAPWLVGDSPSKWTLPRCAEYMLWKLGERTDEEHGQYDIETDCYLIGQDVDPEFMNTVLAGSQRSTEELNDATDCNSGPTI